MDELEKLTDVAGNIEAARRSALKALSFCKTIQETRDFRDKAAAIEQYMKTRDEAGHTVLLASELRVRAERKIGSLLREIPNRKGKTKLGISLQNLQYYQRIAKIPEPEFEERIKKLMAQKKPASTTAMLILHKEIHGFTPRPKGTTGCENCDRLAREIRTLQNGVRAFVWSERTELDLRRLAKLVGLVDIEQRQTAAV